MKKYITRAFAMFLILAVSGITTVFADGLPALSYTEIFVNVQSQTVTINGEQSECAPPYSDDGVTMISMPVIAGAFGAEWYSDVTDDAGKVIVSYSDVKFTYTIDSAEVDVNGQILTMPKPVQRFNDDIIIPLRFFAESLGADVTYDSETGDIIIRNSAENLGVQSDFKMLLKYGNRAKVGNSEQNWRFNKPSDFDANKNYMGNYTFYVNEIDFELQVKKNKKNMSLEQLYLTLQSSETYYGSVESGVMTQKSKGEQAGLPYVFVERRKTGILTQYHGFITGKFIYTFRVNIPYENYETDKNNLTINEILDSFETDYTGGGDDTVDLAAINAPITGEKKEEYKDGNYSWTINPADGWTVNEYYGFYNQVSISRESKIDTGESDDYYDDDYYSALLYGLLYGGRLSSAYNPNISVSVYSNPMGEPVDAWLTSKADYLKVNYNPDYLTVTTPADIQIGDRAAKFFTYEIDYGTYTYCGKSYFIDGSPYRYQISLSYDKREEDTEGFMASAEATISSFVPGEISYEVLGGALEPDNYLITDKITKEFENDYLKFTLPYLWRAEKSYYSKDSVTVVDESNYNSYITINRIYLDDIDDSGELYYKSLEDAAKEILIEERRSLPREIKVLEPFAPTEFKDRKAYEYVLGLESEGRITSTARFTFVQGTENDYWLFLQSDMNLYKGTRVDTIRKNIIETLQFKK